MDLTKAMKTNLRHKRARAKRRCHDMLHQAFNHAEVIAASRRDDLLDRSSCSPGHTEWVYQEQIECQVHGGHAIRVVYVYTATDGGAWFLYRDGERIGYHY